MAISFVAGYDAAANSVSITTPQAGDLILVWAFRKFSATAPTLASGYTSISTKSSSLVDICSARLSAKISNGTETSSGTWTNATHVVVAIYRGTKDTVATAIGGTAFNGNASNALLYGGLTLTDTSGSSWVAGFGGNVQSFAGMDGTMTVLDTHRAGTSNYTNGLDTGNGVSSYAQESLSMAGTNDWVTGTVELIAIMAVEVSDPLALAESLAFLMDKQIAETATIADALALMTGKEVPEDAASLADAVSMVLTHTVSDDEVLSILDALSLLVDKPVMEAATLSESTSALLISLAPHYNRWQPRPLVTMTIGAATKRYSTETLAVPASGYGEAQYGEAQYGES